MSARWDEQSEELLTRFLFGELSEEERAAVEARFLTDGDFFDRLLTIESALLDDYARNRLSVEQMRRAHALFESSSAQGRDLEYTRELVALLRERRAALTAAGISRPATTHREGAFPEAVGLPGITVQRSVGILAQTFMRRRFATALVLILALLLGGLIYWTVRLNFQKRLLEQQWAVMEQRNQEMQKRLEEESQGRSETARQLGIEREERAKAEDLLAQLRSHQSAGFSTITLSPTAFERGTSPRTASLKPKTPQVQLVLRLDPGQFEQYGVVLTTFAGITVWSKDSIPASQAKSGRLVLVVPASLLSYEDYRIELRGLSANGASAHVADYAFKVRE
jgi:hypothetical protein